MTNVEFGTDGARGPYGSEITAHTAYRIGAAAARVIGASDFVLVQDTRPFNDELAEAVTAGLASEGVYAHNGGVLTTPAGAVLADELTRESGKFFAAISLSASHNPQEDAGIKVFGVGGVKLDDAETRQLEAAANDTRSRVRVTGAPTKVVPMEALYQRYIGYLLGTVEPDLREHRFLSGRSIVVDAANGAAYRSAPHVLELLGATVETMHVDPNAEINKDSGATHIDPMLARARQVAAYYAVALDGDADRHIGYDVKSDRVIDGDDALAIAALLMMRNGQRPKGVVFTGYSNLGLQYLMEGLGLPYHETANGDRYVLEAMRTHDLPLGGEYTGHTLYGNVAKRNGTVLTGDGTVTALQNLQAAAKLERSPGQISSWPKLPHVLISIDLPKGVNAKEIMGREHVVTRLGELASGYKSEGILLIRASGTQPVIRILARGKNQNSQDSTDNVVGEVAALLSETAA